MKRVNDLFNKRVINQATGNPMDPVRDVVLSDDTRRIVALVVGGGGWSSEEQIIRWNSVVSVGEYVIVDGSAPFASTDEDTEVADLRKQAYQITGKPVISASGERIGTVGDIFFDDRGAIVGYEIKRGGVFGGAGSNSLLPAEYVQAIGKDAIIATSGELASIEEAEPAAHEEHAPTPGEPREEQARTLGEPREPLAEVPPPLREPRAEVPPPPREPLAGGPAEPGEPFVGERRDIDPDQEFRSP